MVVVLMWCFVDLLVVLLGMMKVGVVYFFLDLVLFVVCI